MKAAAVLGVVVAVALILAGCGEHPASTEARKLVREQALSVGNELAAGVFVDGPDGVETGLRRSYVDRDVDVAVDGQQASVSLWLARTVTREAGGLTPEVSETAVICVEYVVDLDGGNTVIRDSACPEDVASGDHVARESLGIEAGGVLADGGCLEPH